MANGPDREYILKGIAKEKSLLSKLEEEGERVRTRLETLKKELTSLDSKSQSAGLNELSVASSSPRQLTAADKVTLFRCLFRGRDDVYPRLWINAKTERKGYAPACSNEWVRGVCEKPRVKCGDCPNQAFIPVTDEVILDHLQGRHVVGVYPMLKDETCLFLAVDFDKSSWTDDVSAFVETCLKFDVPVSVERSRSGNGAHVWIFFTQPVSASSARKMGCYLITETMSRHHHLSMKSYDRLFPNQDTLPRGGFGNLIALPLQHEPRNRGNTVFLNDQLEAHPDQWAYLNIVQRMTPIAVEKIAQDGARKGQVIGVRLSEVGDDEETVTPWIHSPSSSARPLRIAEPVPAQVRAVLAQRLFVENARLPSALINQIKRLAAFQNPEFYKKQSMRLSTATTPRIINCAEEFPKHIALPRGCQTDLEGLLNGLGSSLLIEDKRSSGQPLKLSFRGELTPV